jgi:hypothetical protein
LSKLAVTTETGGIWAGSFSPGAFFLFSVVPPEAGRVNPPGKTKRKTICDLKN